MFFAFITALFALFFATVSHADVINAVPNAKHANDNTTEAISEITSDDSSVNPDTLSSVVAGDGVYTVDKNAVMRFTTFDVSSIPSGSTITAAALHLQYGAEDGYSGTNPIKYDNGAGLTTTGITPTDITGFSADQSFNLFTAGVDTLSEIQNVDIEFTNNDGAGADAIHFDYLWITVTYTPLTTTIGDGTDPSNSSIAPGASATDLDTFTLQTTSGTDTITAATVTLASGTSGGLSLVAITSNDGLTTYCSAANPASDTVALSSCGIPVTTTLTSFKVRITPKSHANMPAPPGSTYTVTGTVTSFTSTNSQSGTDTDSATVTIDNASPANVTGAAGTAGDSQVALSWTNPADSDFHSVIALRSTSAVSDTPVEGTTYAAGNTIGVSTVACVVASPGTDCIDVGLTNGTSYHYKIFSRDTNVNYATGVVPTGSPFTPQTPADTTAPAAVTNLAASNPTTSTVDLSWTAPGDDGNTGTATTYDMRYSTSVITDGNWASATQASGEPTPQVAGTNQSMTVSGLSSATTYYFAMKTRDEVLNESALSNVVSSTTGTSADTTAPAAVTDLATGSVTSSSIVVSWTAPGDDGSSGTAATYDLRYSTSLITDGNFSSATQVSGEPTPSVAGSSESMTVTGLSASTLYYFALKTSDEVPNTSAISNVPSGTTSAISDTGTPSSGGGGGVAPRRVIFSGKAYPESKIEILRKGALEEIYQQVPSESFNIDEQGLFTFTYTGLLGDDYFFTLRAEDKDGRNTGIVAFSVPLQGDLFEARDILVPPTIGFEKALVSKNETLKVMGYAIPNSMLELEIDGLKYKEAKAAPSGFWSIDADVARFAYGAHRVRVRQIISDTISNFSLIRIFKVSTPSTAKVDLNGDDVVNIQDWSIFLFRWGGEDQELRSKNDFNDDGKINIVDFSIFLRAIKI